MRTIRILPALLSLCLLASCGGKKYDGKERHQSYQETLNDSITAIQGEIDSCNTRLSEVHEAISERLSSFTVVNNPREAGSYIIYTPAAGKYPLRKTGIISRIGTSGQFELIAALSNGNFDHIALTAEKETVMSDTVPHDQALNYRADGLNTVMFAGEAADRLGDFISNNMLNNIMLKYMSNVVVTNIYIPAETKKEIAFTYQLYDLQQQAAHLEMRIPMLHEKIKLLRMHLDANGATDSISNK